MSFGINTSSCTLREDNVPAAPAVHGSVIYELNNLLASVNCLDMSIAKLIEQLRPVSMDPCTFFQDGDPTTPAPAPTPSRCSIASRVAGISDQVRSIEKALRGVKIGIE